MYASAVKQMQLSHSLYLELQQSILSILIPPGLYCHVGVTRRIEAGTTVLIHFRISATFNPCKFGHYASKKSIDNWESSILLSYIKVRNSIFTPVSAPSFPRSTPASAASQSSPPTSILRLPQLQTDEQSNALVEHNIVSVLEYRDVETELVSSRNLMPINKDLIPRAEKSHISSTNNFNTQLHDQILIWTCTGIRLNK